MIIRSSNLMSSTAPFKRAGSAGASDAVPPISKILDNIGNPFSANTSKKTAGSQGGCIETVQGTDGSFAPVLKSEGSLFEVYAPAATGHPARDAAEILFPGSGLVTVESLPSMMRGIDELEQGEVIPAVRGYHV